MVRLNQALHYIPLGVDLGKFLMICHNGHTSHLCLSFHSNVPVYFFWLTAPFQPVPTQHLSSVPGSHGLSRKEKEKMVDFLLM